VVLDTVWINSIVKNYWIYFLFLISCLSGLTLILRNSVWGSDSFGFWAVSCGQNQYASMLSSPTWFVWFLQNIINCNIIVLAIIMTLFYFFALLGIYFFGKKWFKERAYLLPIYVATLTPLFFVESIRLENDFFSFCLAFVALGCFSLFIEKRSPGLLILSVLLACFSVVLWFPSVFVLVLACFLLPLPVWLSYGVLLLGLVVFVFDKWGYVVGSFTQSIGLNAVAEEIPLVGLVFVLHLLHFYKKIPLPLKYYGWFLLLLGALKSKYMFLAVVPLIMGLMVKEKESGLSIPKMGIEKIPTLAFCLLLVSGWFVMGLSMYPTQSDLLEMQQAIDLARSQNQPLYNDWGDGWMLESLGYHAYYKISPPQPDWNNLKRPFVAWSIENISGCERTNKRTQQCN